MLTYTKALAYLVALLGTAVAIVLKNPESFQTAIWASVAVITARKAGNAIVDWKNGRYENK